MFKSLKFETEISDIKQVNPLFSTCRVKVMYHGENNNGSYISKESTERALPTIKNIPIVGEFSEENGDFKGHGGSIDLDTYKYIHTTKPYGVVPESATYSWEEVKQWDGTVKEYLVIDGCYLWTGRYEEAREVIKNGKSQSMEIEVTNGHFDEERDLYFINDFIFSSLCILGDDVSPAFEDSSLVEYSLDKDSFKREFNLMMKDLNMSLNEEEEKMFKDLLEKYSLTLEDLDAKNIDYSEATEEQLEEKIKEVFELPKDDKEVVEGEGAEQEVEKEDETTEPTEPEQDKEGKEDEEVETPKEDEVETEPEPEIEDAETEKEETVSLEEFEKLSKKLAEYESTMETVGAELKSLREFKKSVEMESHKEEVEALVKEFGLEIEDLEDLDIHKFSLDEIKDKCYIALGKKMVERKEFSLDDKSNKKGIKLQVGKSIENKDESPYGGLIEKYKEK